jgi:hypothetical protein
LCDQIHNQIIDSHSRIICNLADLIVKYNSTDFSKDEAEKYAESWVKMLLISRFTFKTVTIDIETKAAISSQTKVKRFDLWNNMSFYLDKIDDVIKDRKDIAEIARDVFLILDDNWLLRLTFNKMLPPELQVGVEFSGFLEDVPAEELQKVATELLRCEAFYPGINIFQNFDQTKIVLSIANVGGLPNIDKLTPRQKMHTVKLLLGLDLGNSRNKDGGSTRHETNAAYLNEKETQLDTFIKDFRIHMVSLSVLKYLVFKFLFIDFIFLGGQ